jgi:hypothetical protein
LASREMNASTARLNLRHAGVVALWAHNSAAIVGVLAALFDFLAVSRRAADWAQDARECAESEVAKAVATLRDESPVR